MKYLVDTDYIIDFLVTQSSVIDLFSLLGKEGIAISLITVGEIYEGIYYGRKPEEDQASFQKFLSTIPTLPLNLSIIQRFARIRGELRRTGQIIGDFDMLIAATAIEYDLILVTRNIKHYKRIPNLSVYQ